MHPQAIIGRTMGPSHVMQGVITSKLSIYCRHTDQDFSVYQLRYPALHGLQAIADSNVSRLKHSCSLWQESGYVSLQLLGKLASKLVYFVQRKELLKL